MNSLWYQLHTYLYFAYKKFIAIEIMMHYHNNQIKQQQKFTNKIKKVAICKE